MKSLVLLFAASLGLVASAAVEPFRPGERVLFYGDSITHGGKYVYYLQLFENLRHPGSGVRLLNGGRSGGSASDGLKNFDRELKASCPDRAFVMFGMNDIGRDKWATENPPEEILKVRERTLARYETNTLKLVKRFQDAGVRTVLMTPTPFDQYNAKAGENISFCNDGLARAAERVRAIASANGLATVELHAPMTKLFKDSANGFVFCRDRVHPGNEGHLYMAAQILAAQGVSPEVGGAVCEAGKDAESARIDYAPKALPFPRMSEGETLEAFYPFTERFNREIICFRGLKSGRYALAFDGRLVGDYSSEALAKGVNVALLDTPNQRRAQTLVPVMRRLQSVMADYRNFVLVERMVEDEKIDTADFAAADKWLDGWLEKQKASPWYLGVKAWVDGYRAGRTRVKETMAEIESLYTQLAAARPVASCVTVTRLSDHLY